MFREIEGKKVFETDNLSAAHTNADEVKVGIQKCYGDKETSGSFFVQCESSYLVATPKTTFIQHELKICFSNQIPSCVY